MTDINLFSPYINEEKKYIINPKFIIVPIAILLALTITYTGWYFYTSQKLENNIIKMNTSLKSERVQTALNQLETQKQEIKILDEYIASASEISTEFESVNTIHTNIIESINKSIPNSIYFSSLSIASNIVEINGTTENRESIAKFQQILSGKEVFSNVYVTSISRDTLNDRYIFVLTSVIRGEENAIK